MPDYDHIMVNQTYDHRKRLPRTRCLHIAGEPAMLVCLMVLSCTYPNFILHCRCTTSTFIKSHGRCASQSSALTAKMLEGSALQEVGQEELECMVSDDVSWVCGVSVGEVLESGALRKREAQTSPTRGQMMSSNSPRRPRAVCVRRLSL